ncbi:MAG: SRPBCC domain-containing protein, partial [Vicinamibacteria bacterium]
TVSVLVKVAPEDAFSIFTTEIDLWWKQGPAYRIAGRKRGQINFECGREGRLFETFELASGPRTFEVGKILAWEPPQKLAFEWRGVNFKPDEKTMVEVTFQPSASGTSSPSSIGTGAHSRTATRLVTASPGASFRA